MEHLRFKSKSRWREFAGEKLISISAFTALLSILLIFVFVFKEAIPIFVDDYIKEDASLDKMLCQQEFYEGREAKWSWQPNSEVPKFSLLPLFIGTLKAALVAMLFAIPLGVGAAIYSSEFASRRMGEIIKPAIETFAAIPSVVLGFFALMVLSSFLQQVMGLTFRLNAMNAGIALGLAIVPIIFTVAEDAMTSVPGSLRDAAIALGATPWQVSLTTVLPAAMPGIFAGIVLGFGRAVGETMIVLMASGNAAIISISVADSVRTFSATIAAELGEVVFGDTHYHVLFLIGLLLFIFTFVVNLGGDIVLTRLKERLQGRTT
ncbi:MAG: phosphate ABC transporter permease subunit PstC [candidate division Zixibacteria bacterium]|nr:phosphate ABC transporter permease subunit PstC [candidate division Zixibacteria bacterium]